MMLNQEVAIERIASISLMCLSRSETSDTLGRVRSNEDGDLYPIKRLDQGCKSGDDTHFRAKQKLLQFGCTLGQRVFDFPDRKSVV